MGSWENWKYKDCFTSALPQSRFTIPSWVVLLLLISVKKLTFTVAVVEKSQKKGAVLSKLFVCLVFLLPERWAHQKAGENLVQVFTLLSQHHRISPYLAWKNHKAYFSLSIHRIHILSMERSFWVDVIFAFDES